MHAAVEEPPEVAGDATGAAAELERLRASVAERDAENAALRRQLAECHERHQRGSARKLAAIGKLAGGIAHEINTPIQFATDSLWFLKDAFEDLFGLLERWSGPGGDRRDGSPPVDLDYLREEVPLALDSALEGIGRIEQVVRAMGSFTRSDPPEQIVTDLNQCLRDVLTLARTAYKYVADLDLELGEVPPVRCHPGDLLQALLDLVVQAAKATAGACGERELGVIRIRTFRVAAEVRVEVHHPGEAAIDAPELAAAAIVLGEHGGHLDRNAEGGRTTWALRLAGVEAPS